MASDVSICSAALLMLGDDPIASLTENTSRARLCANLYPLAKLDILRAHPWNCATKRVILPPLATAPDFDWSQQFALPGDWLRTLSVGIEGQPEEYAMEGRRVLANTSTLYLRYVSDITEGSMDSLLVHVLTKRMEMDLAYPITKSTSHRDSLKTEFYARGVGVLAQAKTIDGQEVPPEDWSDSSLLRARAGGR